MSVLTSVITVLTPQYIPSPLQAQDHHKLDAPWAAQYNTWLLIKLKPKGVVFSLISKLDASKRGLQCVWPQQNVSVFAVDNKTEGYWPLALAQVKHSEAEKAKLRRRPSQA